MLTTIKIEGRTIRQLYDTKGLEFAQTLKANGAPESMVRNAYLAARKKMFASNSFWKFLRFLTGKDIKIPYLTGHWTYDAIISNTITNVGKKIIADQIGGTTTAPVTAIAIGTGSPSATALGAEITTNGGERGAATISNTTITTTGDTEQWVKLFSFTGSFAITEEGLFDNNTSGGKMLASQSFSAVNVANGDTIQITHQVKIT